MAKTTVQDQLCSIANQHSSWSGEALSKLMSEWMTEQGIGHTLVQGWVGIVGHKYGKMRWWWIELETGLFVDFRLGEMYAGVEGLPNGIFRNESFYKLVMYVAEDHFYGYRLRKNERCGDTPIWHLFI